jgi:hypothetical protein
VAFGRLFVCAGHSSARSIHTSPRRQKRAPPAGWPVRHRFGRMSHTGFTADDADDALKIDSQRLELAVPTGTTAGHNEVARLNKAERDKALRTSSRSLTTPQRSAYPYVLELSIELRLRVRPVRGRILGGRHCDAAFPLDRALFGTNRDPDDRSVRKRGVEARLRRTAAFRAKRQAERFAEWQDEPKHPSESDVADARSERDGSSKARKTGTGKPIRSAIADLLNHQPLAYAIEDHRQHGQSRPNSGHKHLDKAACMANKYKRTPLVRCPL